PAGGAAGAVRFGDPVGPCGAAGAGGVAAHVELAVVDREGVDCTTGDGAIAPDVAPCGAVPAGEVRNADAVDGGETAPRVEFVVVHREGVDSTVADASAQSAP